MVTSRDPSRVALASLVVRVLLLHLRPITNDAIRVASADPQTDKAAIEEAEKRIGEKEE
jgi:hypothetical protein